MNSFICANSYQRSLKKVPDYVIFNKSVFCIRTEIFNCILILFGQARVLKQTGMSEKQKYWTNWYVDSLMFKKEDIQNWKKNICCIQSGIVSTKIFSQTVLLVLTYLIRPSIEFLSQMLIDTRLTLGLTNIKKQLGFLAPNNCYVCKNWMFL